MHTQCGWNQINGTLRNLKIDELNAHVSETITVCNLKKRKRNTHENESKLSKKFSCSVINKLKLGMYLDGNRHEGRKISTPEKKKKWHEIGWESTNTQYKYMNDMKVRQFGEWNKEHEKPTNVSFLIFLLRRSLISITEWNECFCMLIVVHVRL